MQGWKYAVCTMATTTRVPTCTPSRLPFFLFSSASLFHSAGGSSFLLHSLAASNAPLNCPEVSAIEIFMDSRAKLKLPSSLHPSVRSVANAKARIFKSRASDIYTTLSLAGTDALSFYEVRKRRNDENGQIVLGKFLGKVDSCTATERRS